MEIKENGNQRKTIWNNCWRFYVLLRDERVYGRVTLTRIRRPGKMVIVNNKFKSGTNRTTPTARIKPTNENDTDDAILNFAGVGIAENAFRILQSNNIFTNGVYFVVDEFTDSSGINNTTNFDNNSALRSTDNYNLIGFPNYPILTDSQTYSYTNTDKLLQVQNES